MNERFIATLEQIVAQRLAEADSDASYTARLAEQGAARIAQKVGEEGVEVALAMAVGDDKALISESADLLYHLIVALEFRNIPLQAVYDELAARHAPST